MKLFIALTLMSVLINCKADVSHVINGQHHYAIKSTTPQPGPANPYIFSYQAGRAPGHIDRQHTEVSDGTGVIRGAFSYVDPKNQLRTVQYVADEKGFHPQLSHQLEDSEAVKRAKQKHFALYNRIAQEHANQQLHHPADIGHYDSGTGPQQSEAVVRATNKHLSLYERIAAEHAAIGAQHEAERKAFEATSVHTPIEDGHYQQQHY